jgi:putative aminopeptidase FrvX
MASRTAAEKWLGALTNLPTASGREDEVVRWVERWVGRRPDLKMAEDSGGNLLITRKGRKRGDPVLAVAHMDHPAFVVTGVAGQEAAFQFRGGVRAEYFNDARVDFVTGPAKSGRVTSYAPLGRTGVIDVKGTMPEPGDIARWHVATPRQRAGRLMAPACDDLAGCAAALAALDLARGRTDLAHFGVLLTRAEEMGFVGAIHAAVAGSIPTDARLLSIETSRASADAPLGEGPVIRVGDAVTVFDRDLTNRISSAAAGTGLRHQRKLMVGGACEATAFGVYDYIATGLCLPLGNYHNMGNLDEVEAGTGEARPMLEEVSLDDFHGLVDLLLIAAGAVDHDGDLRERLDMVYSDGRHLLG